MEGHEEGLLGASTFHVAIVVSSASKPRRVSDPFFDPRLIPRRLLPKEVSAASTAEAPPRRSRAGQCGQRGTQAGGPALVAAGGVWAPSLLVVVPLARTCSLVADTGAASGMDTATVPPTASHHTNIWDHEYSLAANTQVADAVATTTSAAGAASAQSPQPPDAIFEDEGSVLSFILKLTILHGMTMK